MSKPIAGFIVNLLQDVNILRPLIYIAADNIGLRPIIFVTKSFSKRDKSNPSCHENNLLLGTPFSDQYFESASLIENKHLKFDDSVARNNLFSKKLCNIFLVECNLELCDS